MKEWTSKWFCGNELTKEDLEMGYISYSTFAKAFECVLNNEIIPSTFEHYWWELVNGTDYNEEDDYYYDIFQYYIVDNTGADLIQEFLPNDILYYCEELDMYIWGITHYGTSWTMVPTDIKINLKED